MSKIIDIDDKDKEESPTQNKHQKTETSLRAAGLRVSILFVKKVVIMRQKVRSEASDSYQEFNNRKIGVIRDNIGQEII